VLVKIRSLYSSLPKAERNVADYIQQNPERAPHRSVHEFARAGGVSVASVSRFVRKLGFSDFKEFKLELARETTGVVQSLFKEITPEDSDEEITRKVFLGDIKSLEDTLKMLSFADMTAAARAICAGRRLVFFGIGGSAHVSHDAALRFSYLDFQAEAYVDASQILLQALRVAAVDVVIGISHSGRSATSWGVVGCMMYCIFPPSLSRYSLSRLTHVSMTDFGVFGVFFWNTSTSTIASASAR